MGPVCVPDMTLDMTSRLCVVTSHLRCDMYNIPRATDQQIMYFMRHLEPCLSSTVHQVVGLGLAELVKICTSSSGGSNSSSSCQASSNQAVTWFVCYTLGQARDTGGQLHHTAGLPGYDAAEVSAGGDHGGAGLPHGVCALHARPQGQVTQADVQLGEEAGQAESCYFVSDCSCSRGGGGFDSSTSEILPWVRVEY